MVILHITAVDLEQHLHNMKTNGQYLPTVNNLVEALQKSEELASKTSFFWFIIVWSIACYSYQYFYTTFLSALKITTRQHLRAFLIKFFFNHTNNPNSEIQA